MAFKSPEEELEQFLAAQPSWLRKILQLDVPQTPEEQSAWIESDWWQNGSKVEEEYVRLLQRIPAKWRRYRAKLKKIALRSVPLGRAGRPRKDEEAEELKEKYGSGKSYGQIAHTRLRLPRQLNDNDNDARAERILALKREAERIRKLIGSRKPRKSRSTTPDKT